MIKTKFLEETSYLDDHYRIDEFINNFIQENPHIEIIDIKFQSNMSYVQETDATMYHTSALIVYKCGREDE